MINSCNYYEAEVYESLSEPVEFNGIYNNIIRTSEPVDDLERLAKQMKLEVDRLKELRKNDQVRRLKILAREISDKLKGLGIK